MSSNGKTGSTFRRDCIWAGVGSILIITASAFPCVWEIISGQLQGREGEIYGALASILASLLGFVLATAAIILSSWEAPSLSRIREHKARTELWSIFIGAVWTLGVATVALLACLFISSGDSPNRVAYHLAVAVVPVSFWLVGRCIWALEKIILIVTRNPKA